MFDLRTVHNYFFFLFSLFQAETGLGIVIYSRTSLLRTPGDFADLYVVSIGRCNHGPLNQIRYTKFTQTNFIKKLKQALTSSITSKMLTVT